MDIQADIKWIMTELPKVKDPDLVAAFKNLLRYRSRKEEVDQWDDLPMEIQEGIERGLKDVEEGRTSTHEEVQARIKKKFGL